MRTLILLFATLSTLQVSAQSPVTQSYGFHVQHEMVLAITESVKQASVEAESLIAALQQVFPVLSISLSGDKCTTTVAATVAGKSASAANTFTFLGDTYPDVPVLAPSEAAAPSAPAVASASPTFDFMGDSFDEIPAENMLIPGSFRPEPTFLFMGDTYQDFPAEGILPQIMM